MEEGTGAANTTISFKFDGKDMNYDISDPDQLKAVVNDLQLGNLHKKKEKEMAETLRNVQSKADMFDKFDKWMESIRSGADPEPFINALQDSTGLKLSIGEKEAIRDGYFDDDDRISGLFKEITNLKSELKKTKTENYWQQKSETAHLKFGAKYDGKDGLPPYDAVEVEKFCRDKGLMLADIEEQYELAYQLMNKDKISEASVERQKKKEQETARKRDYTGSGDGHGFNFNDAPVSVKGKSYSQLAAEAAKTLREKGVPIFTDED